MERRRWSVMRLRPVVLLHPQEWFMVDENGYPTLPRRTLPALYEAMIAEDERLTGEGR